MSDINTIKNNYNNKLTNSHTSLKEEIKEELASSGGSEWTLLGKFETSLSSLDISNVLNNDYKELLIKTTYSTHLLPICTISQSGVFTIYVPIAKVENSEHQPLTINFNTKKIYGTDYLTGEVYYR